MLHGELLNDVIEPVTFVRSAGGRRTYHTYIYRRIAQHGTACVGLAQAICDNCVRGGGEPGCRAIGVCYVRYNDTRYVNQ